MNSFEFLYPQFFVMFLLPLIWLIYTLTYKKRVKQDIFAPEILKKLITSSGGFSIKTRTILTLFSLFFMIVALAKPVIKDGVLEVESKSVDIVIALDISKSMLAKDRYPNRLDFSKHKIIEILHGLKKNRVGVIAFAHNGYTVSPLSFDKIGVEYLVQNLDSKNISEQGTSIKKLLQSADMFLKENKDKLLIIFSDGGDSTNYSEEIQFAKDKEIKIFVVGIGSEQGSPIELEDGNFLKDNGTIVITKFNNAIKDLAIQTNGIFLNGVNSQEDINYILGEIENIDSDEVKKDKVPIYKEFFIYPLILSLLFIFPIFYSLPRFAFIFLLFMIPNTEIQAGIFDWYYINQAENSFENGQYSEAIEKYSKLESSDKTNFNIGDSYYKQGNFQKAIDSFRKVSKDDLKQKALYNIGNSYVKMEKLPQAKSIYEKALKLGENPKVRENLEWVKNRLKQDKQNKEQNQKRNQKQSDNQKDKQNQESDKNKQDEQKEKDSKKSDKENQKNSKESESKKGETDNHDKKKSENGKDSPEKNTSKKDKVSKSAENNLTETRDLNKSEKMAIQNGNGNKDILKMEEKKLLNMLNRIKGGTKIYTIPINTPNAQTDKIENPW